MTVFQHRVYIGIFAAVTIISTALIGINGYSYYITPIEDEFFNPLHQSLKPSGIWGHGFGIIGSLMMIFGVAVYMIRKRIKKFVRIGPLKYWLEFHIFLCTLGPILVLYHTAFKFGGIVAVSFWSMVAVVLSGIAGRFVYVRIPRNIQGQELKLEELNEMNISITSKINNIVSLDDSKIRSFESEIISTSMHEFGFFETLNHLIKSHSTSKKILDQIKQEFAVKEIPCKNQKEIIVLIKNKLALLRKIELLRSMQKIFKYWHVAHLPFAIIMLIIMLVHVAVTIIFGYKWIF